LSKSKEAIESARSKKKGDLHTVGIPAEAVVDRKKLKEYQNSKFEQYAINSKK
jgi:hypothetical protein